MSKNILELTKDLIKNYEKKEKSDQKKHAKNILSRKAEFAFMLAERLTHIYLTMALKGETHLFEGWLITTPYLKSHFDKIIKIIKSREFLDTIEKHEILLQNILDPDNYWRTLNQVHWR